MNLSFLRKKLQEIRSALLPTDTYVTEIWTRQEPGSDLWKGFCAIEGRTLELTQRELESRWKKLHAMNCRFSPMLFERTDDGIVPDTPKAPLPCKVYVNIDLERI